ncbi:MAG: substrate-binding domain-containing protein, partial [Chitinophagaceae bacterium]
MSALSGRKGAALLVLFFCLLLMNGCKSYKAQQDELTDTAERGTIHISADESFKPVIDEQVQVYEALYPGTHIVVHYKPEAECLKDFYVDSIRMVIATRSFSKSEERFMSDSLKTGPEMLRVALDAIAVVLHPQSPDSVLSMQDVRAILTGRFSKTLIPVFDGTQATSTVRFIVDSVLHGDTLTAATVGARSSREVIDYVASHPNAVGFVGVSWIGNREDTMQVSFLKKVKIAYLESREKPGKYILPVQENIYLDRYPMVRDLVYNLKENFKGLGHG